MSFRMLETIYKLNIGQLTLSVGFIGNILRIEQIGNSKIQNHTRFEFMHWHLAFLGCVVITLVMVVGAGGEVSVLSSVEW